MPSKDHRITNWLCKRPSRCSHLGFLSTYSAPGPAGGPGGTAKARMGNAYPAGVHGAVGDAGRACGSGNSMGTGPEQWRVGSSPSTGKWSKEGTDRNAGVAAHGVTLCRLLDLAGATSLTYRMAGALPGELWWRLKDIKAEKSDAVQSYSHYSTQN